MSSSLELGGSSCLFYSARSCLCYSLRLGVRSWMFRSACPCLPGVKSCVFGSVRSCSLSSSLGLSVNSCKFDKSRWCSFYFDRQCLIFVRGCSVVLARVRYVARKCSVFVCRYLALFTCVRSCSYVTDCFKEE